MSEQPQQIDQLLEATPIEVAGKVVQPVARLTGWQRTFGAAGAGAMIRLEPVSITVRDGDRHYTIPITDPTGGVLRTFFLIGGAVTLLSLFVMLLTTLLVRQR